MIDREIFRARPILLFFAAVWLVEAGMNTLYGWRRSGGGLVNPAAWGNAAMFFSFAVIAAWLPTQWGSIAGWWRKTLIACAIGFCFVMGQLSGWSVMGVTLADGALVREIDATKGLSQRQSLKQLIDRQKELGPQPDPTQIEAQIRAQLTTFVKGLGKTVAEASQSCKEPAAAPSTCKRVALLEADLKKAQEAQALPKKIEDASKTVDRGPKVAEGSHDVDTIVAIVMAWWDYDRASAEKIVRFWMPIFIVAGVGFFANFGFAMAGVRHDAGLIDVPSPPLPQRRQLPAPRSLSAAVPERDPGFDPGDLPPLPRSDDDERTAPAHARDLPPIDRSAPPAVIVPPPGASPHAAQHSGAHYHGAPINISLALPGQQGVPAGGFPAGASAAVAEGIMAPPATAAAQPLDVRAVAPPAADRPVDRGAVNALIDNLLVFRSACLVDTPGSLVTGDDMYRRYAMWAGARALARPAFETMFGPATAIDLVAFAGVPHWRGIAVRDEPALQAVGA